MTPRILRLLTRVALVVLVMVVIVAGVATVGGPVLSAGARVAVTLFTGSASLMHPGVAMRPMHTGDRVDDGDTVITGADSKASLLYPDGSVTRLDSETTVNVHVIAGSSGGVQTTLTQTAGLTWNSVKQLVGGSSFTINGPNSATAGVRGTEFGYYVEHDSAGNPVIWIDTWSGSVEVRGATGPAVTATTGQRVTVRQGAAPTVPAPIPQADRELSFTVFNQALDAVTGTPVAAVSGTLSPGGTSTAGTVAADGRSSVQFVLAWPGSTFGLTVRDASSAVLAQPTSPTPPLSVVVHPNHAQNLSFVVSDVQSTPGEAWWIIVGRS